MCVRCSHVNVLEKLSKLCNAFIDVIIIFQYNLANVYDLRYTFRMLILRTSNGVIGIKMYHVMQVFSLNIVWFIR